MKRFRLSIDEATGIIVGLFFLSIAVSLILTQGTRP